MRFAAIWAALALSTGCQSTAGYDPRYGNVGATIPPPGTGSYGTVRAAQPGTNPGYYTPQSRQVSATGDFAAPADAGWRSPGQSGDGPGGIPARAAVASYTGETEQPALRMADVNSRWPAGARFRGMRVNDATAPSEPGRFSPAENARELGGMNPPAIDMSGAQVDRTQSGNTNTFGSPATGAAAGMQPSNGLLFRPPAVGRSGSQ